MQVCLAFTRAIDLLFLKKYFNILAKIYVSIDKTPGFWSHKLKRLYWKIKELLLHYSYKRKKKKKPCALFET